MYLEPLLLLRAHNAHQEQRTPTKQQRTPTLGAAATKMFNPWRDQVDHVLELAKLIQIKRRSWKDQATQTKITAEASGFPPSGIVPHKLPIEYYPTKQSKARAVAREKKHGKKIVCNAKSKAAHMLSQAVINAETVRKQSVVKAKIRCKKIIANAQRTIEGKRTVKRLLRW